MKIQEVRDMQKLVILSWLLVETLDDLKATTPEMTMYKNTLTAFGEHLNNELADTDIIQKSTYFNDLTKKVNTVIRKNVKDV